MVMLVGKIGYRIGSGLGDEEVSRLAVDAAI
jgi:hypothetical protein